MLKNLPWTGYFCNLYGEAYCREVGGLHALLGHMAREHHLCTSSAGIWVALSDLLYIV